MRWLRRPPAPITVSGGNRSRLIHRLTGSGLLPQWSANRKLVQKTGLAEVGQIGNEKSAVR
jgi:hypothetical protein